MRTGDCGCSDKQVDLMFRKAEQFIDQQITDLTPGYINYWADFFPVKPFPDGLGLVLEKLRFHGDIGPQYDGLDGWRKVQISRTAAEGALCGKNDGCGYNFEEVGHGMDTVRFDLMQRELKTSPICVKDIRTFFQYEEVQNLIYKNLARITQRQKEQVNRNIALLSAIKHVALPGLPTNRNDQRDFPDITSGVEIGKLNYRLLKNFYPFLAEEAGQYSMGMMDGMPLFGVVASPETLDDMVMEDPNLRKDLRYCSDTSCSLIKKYNFLDSIGPFVLMPDIHAPRYNRDSSGKLYRVFPHDRNVQIEIGTRAATNPVYHNAEFEFVQFLTTGMFTVRTRRAITTVGGATKFEAELPPFEWKWFADPSQPIIREGYYFCTAELGFEPGEFTDRPGVLVKRRPVYHGIEYWAAEVGPEEASEVDNSLDDMDCPCQQVIGQFEAVADDEIILVFDRDTELSEDEPAEISTVSGGFVAATVEEVSSDGTRVRFSFEVAPCNEAGHFTELRCTTKEYCSAKVLKSELCGILGSEVKLFLDRPIRAEATENIVLNTGDGTALTRALVASGVDGDKLTYTVTLTFADYCNHQGVCSVCVPPATDGDCPACTDPDLEDCES